MAWPRPSSKAAARSPTGSTGTRPATASTRMAGATPRRPTSASCSASSAGATARQPRVALGRLADNDMTGNGLQEQRLLARDRASIYTLPDTTQNRSLLLNLEPARIGSATRSRSRATPTTATSAPTTLNGDVNDDSLDQPIYQPNAAEQTSADRGRLQRLSDQRRQRREHAVSAMALHRQRAAERRARREVLGRDQHHRDAPAELRPRRPAVVAGEPRRPRQPVRRRRRARPQPRPFHAGVASSASSIPIAASPASARSATAA